MTALQDAERALWARFDAAPRERFVDLRRPEIRVRVLEIGEGPPAVFVHGAMTGASSFASLAARLSGMRCILLDRPGCVASEAWSLAGAEFRVEAIETLVSLLDALELDRVTLVGNSLGALWCTWMALAHPERVVRLAVLGPSIGFPGVRPPTFMRVLSTPGLGAFVFSRMRFTTRSLERVFIEMGHERTILAGNVPKEMFEWGACVHAETSTARNELESLRRAVGPFGARAWTMLGEAELRSIEPPMLVVSGESDTHGGPKLARHIAELVPRATLEILDGGHLPWLDEPQTVARLLERS